MLTPILRYVLPAPVLGPRHGRHVSLRPFLVDGAGYGGLVGDVVDVARLLRLHLGGGAIDGQRVLSEASTRAMRQIVARGRHFDHAIGWFRRHAHGQQDYVEHFGAGVGFWNVMRIYPTRGIGVALMSNGTSALRFGDLMTRLAELGGELRASRDD
jgi:CubicO group peptidase (beta-lactamase class C family)